jgi:DNA polymerase
MPTYVPGFGNASAKLLLLGEFPSKIEEERLESFAGPSGEMIQNLIQQSGMSWSETYRTNAIKYRPPQGKIENLNMLGIKVEDCVSELVKEIQAIGPNCILAFGEVALNAITNHEGIKKWRGSLLSSPNCGIKTVATVHPGSIIQGTTEGMISWKDLAYIGLDVKRAVEQSSFPELNLPKRNLWYAKNSGQVWDFFQRHKDNFDAAVDIETFKTYPMCIGIAFDSYEACCIPLFPIFGKNREIKMVGNDRTEAWRLVADFLSGKCKKMGQNFKFDQTLLEERLKMKVENFYFDTMIAFHCLYAELWKSLAFQTSVGTLEPYYKDEGKEYDPKKDDPERFLLYCAKDAVVTYELSQGYRKDMKEVVLW